MRRVTLTLPQVKGILKPPFHYLRQKFANINFQLSAMFNGVHE